MRAVRALRVDGDTHSDRQVVGHDEWLDEHHVAQGEAAEAGEANGREHQVEVAGAGQQRSPLAGAVLVDDPVGVGVEATEEARPRRRARRGAR